LAYDLYKGPYGNFNPYNQSRDTSREDAIRRLLSFSSNQPSVSGSSFNDLVETDLQEQYRNIYGDNVPQNTTLKIPQITDNPNYPALDLYSPEIPVREELPKLPSQFKGDMLLNYKSPSIPVPKSRSYLDAIKDWSDRASMAAGEIITGIDRPDKPQIGDFEVISRGLMSDKDKLPDNIKINLPESYTSDRPVNLNSADLAGGLAGFLAGGEFNVGSKVFQGAENAIGQALAKLGAKSPKVANIPNITQSAIKVGGATAPYEYSRSIANDREFDTGEAAQAGATNAALGVILGRLGSALGRDRTPAPAPTEFRMPEYKAPDMSNFTPEELANIRSRSMPGEMITPETVTTKEVAAAQRTLRNTPNIGKANKILDEFPELEKEFPHFRLQQGDTVILPSGKEATVKNADKMIIQVDVDGKTASIGRKVVKVPEVKVDVPEVVGDAIPEVPEIATSEIKQQPIVNDVPTPNNRSGAEAFADESIPDVSVKQEPIVAQEALPQSASELVPPEVLKDYPELSTEVGSKPTSGTKDMAEDVGLKPEKAETYDEGTIGAAKLTVPEKQSTLPGTDEKVRSFQVTGIKSPVTDDLTKAGLLVDIYRTGPGAYRPVSNLETEAVARKFIEDNGIDAAINRVMDKTETSAEQVALGGQLTYSLQKLGKHEEALNMLESLAEQLTSAGQKIQAVKIFQNLSPEGVLIKANKETKKAFNELPKQTKDKHDDLSGKLQDEFNGIDKEAIDQVVNETPELGGNKPKPKQGKPGSEKQTDPANMLAQKIVSYTKPMMPVSRLTPEMQMVKTLFSKAREVLPIEKAKLPKQNALDEVVTALQQSDNYRKTWEDAKQSIIEQNGELPQVMKDVEAYIEHYLNVPYSERSLERIVTEKMKDKNFDLEQSAFGPMSPNFRGTKLENTAFIQSIVKDSGLTGKNAEVLSLELGSKLDEALTKKRNDKTSDLAKRIIKMATENPKDAETNPVKEMFNILMQKAKESMPKVEGAKPTKDGMLPVYNALNNRKMFNAVWSEAKKDIVKRLKAKGLSVEGVNLDQMFAELLYHPYTKGQLSREVSKGIKQYGIDVNNIVRQHFTVAEKTGQDLAEKLTTKGMLPKDEAALLAQDIQKRFAEVAETKKAQILKNMFREKSLTKEHRTIDQKIIELSNLGALSKEQYRRSVAEKMGLPVLTEDIANRLVALAEQAQMAEGRQAEILRAQMAKILAEQKPVSFWRKVSSVQTFSQLLNLKTATRNLVGNAGFNALENVSDVVGAGIDKGVSLVTGKRSKVLPSIATQVKGGIKGAKEGIEDAMLGIDTLGYDGKFDLPQSRTFKKGIMGRLETALNIELKATDRAFYKAAYEESLRNQMVAEKVKKPTDKMLEHAHLDGLYRTFQDENVLSNMFVGVKRILNANKEFGIGDMILKYPKTPSNLLMRGVDYSPAGFMKVLVEASRPLLKGEFNQKAFVEAFSRALVGSTALFGTGILLHKLGIITGRREKDKELAELQRQNGFAEYRINVSALRRLMFGDGNTKPQNGDKIINYDWMLPNTIPLAIGADIDKNKGKATGLVGTVLNAFSTGINAFAEQPVIQGFETLFSGAKGSFDQGLLRILEGVPASFMPTFLNQIKQLTDNQRRETYDPNWAKNMANKSINKIPGLANNLPQKYGTLGQPLETYQDGGNNPFNVLLNPAFVNTYKPSPEVQKVTDIYDQTGETKQIPRIVDKTIKVTGQKRVDGKLKSVTEEFELSGEEFAKYQKLIGEKTNAGIAKVSNRLTPEAQTKRIQGIMDKANQEAKIQILRERGLRVIKNGNGIKILNKL